MAGIYIHIPYCRKACSYCDFHFSTQTDTLEEMVRSLCLELELVKLFPGIDTVVRSVYFGGGTPSLLSERHLHALMEATYRHYTVAENVEVTLEANPDDVRPDSVSRWTSAGVNRISLGVQSFSDQELVWMNRSHDADTAARSIRQLQDAGLHHLSADLIFGGPLQDDDTLLRNLDRILEFGLPHLSCYALTVEPRTRLYHEVQRGLSEAPDPERQARQFLLLHDRLTSAGFDHYEVSNYGLPGFHSRHNSQYWNGTPYVGIGPSAHSYDGDRCRRWHPRNNLSYLKALRDGRPEFEEERLTRAQQLNEYILTSLRTQTGIRKEKMENQFGAEEWIRIRNLLQGRPDKDSFRIDAESIRLTPEGWLMADAIATDCFM